MRVGGRKGLPVKGGAVVARRLLNRKAVRSELSRSRRKIVGCNQFQATKVCRFSVTPSQRRRSESSSWRVGWKPTVRSRGCAAWRCRSCSHLDRKRLRKCSRTTTTPSRRRARSSSSAASSTGGLMFLDFEEHHFHRRIMQEAFTRERLGGYLHSMDDDRSAQLRRRCPTRNCWFTPTSNAHCSTSRPSCSWATSPDRKADLMTKAFTDCLRAASAVVRFPVPGLRWSAGVRGRRALEEYFHTNECDAKRALWRRRPLRSSVPRPRRGRQSVHRRRRRQPHDFSHVGRHRYLRGRRDGGLAPVGTPSGVAGPGSRRVHRLRLATGRLDLDALDRMRSLGMVINESMRLFAPVPGSFRKTLMDTSIQGYFVPADTMVVVVLWLNHYWPGLWTEPSCIRSRAVQRSTA